MPADLDCAVLGQTRVNLTLPEHLAFVHLDRPGVRRPPDATILAEAQPVLEFQPVPPDIGFEPIKDGSADE